MNVPTINIESSLTILPRRYNDLGIIMVKLKKRVVFKSSVWQETIRVDAIKKAAKVLQNAEVYRAENINVNFDNLERIINETKNSL